jgi:hypothetical protein
VTDTTVDLAAIQAAANAALAAPADAPALQFPPQLECETGCGRPLNVVLTWVADSETRILCDVCALLMFMKLAEEIPAAMDSPDTANPA